MMKKGIALNFMIAGLSQHRCKFAVSIALAILAQLSGCATQVRAPSPVMREADVRGQVLALIPAKVGDRVGWANDIAAAFAALQIGPRADTICATLAITEQESTYTADPVVPGLGRIARAEIDRRATQHHVPLFVVRGAMLLSSPNGKSYGDRIAAVRTERQMSVIYEDFISEVPLGRQLFADANPVHTGGPMQVSIAFAEQHADEHRYPYATDASIRHEVFTRRGGLYFGIAHLLGYPANYPAMRFRFADFNAGHYASRNAAFQNAVSLASGVKLALDGDLVLHDSREPGATERAVRKLGPRLKFGDAQIHRALEKGEQLAFEDTDLYSAIFALADQVAGKSLPRAVIPKIALKSPKITRPLTTEWFAQRVDQRYQTCLARALPQAAPSGGH